MATKINSFYYPSQYEPAVGSCCLHTVKDASRWLGVSESTVRRALSRHGVRVGRTVSGMLRLRAGASMGFVPVTTD